MRPEATITPARIERRDLSRRPSDAGLVAAFFDGELPADRFAEAPAAAAPEPAAAAVMAVPQQAVAVTPLPQAMAAMADTSRSS